MGEGEDTMKQDGGRQEAKQRIRDGGIGQQDVIRGLTELAFGKVNDCVRLVLEETPDLQNLDLSLLREVKRTEKGAVEIKLIDRLAVLQQLAQMTESSNSEMDSLLQALQDTEDA